MNRTKSILGRLMVLALVLSIVLGACGSPTPEATKAPETQPTKAPVVEATKPAEPVPTAEAVAPVEDPYANVDPSGQEIMFWHNHSGDRETALNEIIADFNANNEWGITVSAEYQGSYADIYNKMLTFMNTADVANVVVAYQNNAASYQLANALVDMNPLVSSPKWGLSAEEQADFFPGFWAQDVFPLFQNQRLGFPPNRSMEVVFVNMDWLKELGYDAPPTTPAEFKEMACKASKQKFSKSQAEDTQGWSFTNDASNTASLIFAMGGDVFDPETGKYTYDTDAARSAMQLIQDMFNEGCAVQVTERYGEQTDFATGRSLFAMGSTSGLYFYKDAIEGAANFNWTVAAPPHSTSDPVTNIYGASVSIPKTTPEKDLAAWLFIKYYTSKDVQEKWARVSGYFPVRASVADGLGDYFAEVPQYKTGFDMLQYGKFEPAVPGYDPVRDLVTKAVAAVQTGADIDATLKELDANANAILAEQMALVPESPDTWKDVDPSGQEVTFWHNHSGDRETALAEIIQKFNDENPYGITVNAEYQGSYADIYNKMLAVLNTQDVPDLVVAYQNNAATYQVADALVDMTSLVNSYKWGLSPNDKNDFFKGFYNQDIFPLFNNQRLGFPPNRSEEVLFVNMDWLKELGYDAPPTTPEQYVEMACKASKQKFSKSQVEDTQGLSFTNDASNFASWTFAFGGDIFDAKAGQYVYNGEASVKAAQMLQDMFKNGCAVMVTERYGEQTDFATGRSLFTFGSTSGLYFYQDAIDGGAQFNWTVAAPPHTTKDPVTNIYGASVSMPKTTPENELATWLFLKYYTSKEVQEKWARVSGYFPVRASVAAGLDDYFAETPQYKAGFDLLKYGKFEPAVPGYDPVRDLVTKAIAAIIDGADVQATLDQLTVDANAILAEQMTIVPTPVPTKAP